MNDNSQSPKLSGLRLGRRSRHGSRLFGRLGSGNRARVRTRTGRRAGETICDLSSLSSSKNANDDGGFFCFSNGCEIGGGDDDYSFSSGCNGLSSKNDNDANCDLPEWFKR